MKFLILLTAFLSFEAFSASVKSAKIDSAGENILVDVVYGGGCKVHKFSLKIDPYCLESYPVQCSARLVEEIVGGGEDYCQAIIHTTAVINLEKHGLNDRYFNGAELTIRGDRGFNGQNTSVSVQLPFQED